MSYVDNGTDGASPPAIPGTGVRGWLRSIYDKLVAGVEITNDVGNPIPVVSTGSNGVIDAGNSSTTPLAAGATFTGTWTDVLAYGQVNFAVNASHASATDGMAIEWSTDGVNVDDTDTYTVPAANGQTLKFGSGWRYVRVRYTNGSTLQTYFRLQTILRPAMQKSSTHRAADSVNDQQDTDLVTALLKARNPTTGGYEPITTDTANRLVIGDRTVTPVTVTASASGSTLVYQPAAGKSARLLWYHLAGSPSNGASVIASLRWATGGANFVSVPISQYGSALAHAPGAGNRYYQGAVDQGLFVNLSAAQSVTVNIDVEDI